MESVDPKDVIKLKERLTDETIPCNIHGLIQEILDRLHDLDGK